jgi:hypothetical protein
VTLSLQSLRERARRWVAGEPGFEPGSRRVLLTAGGSKARCVAVPPLPNSAGSMEAREREAKRPNAKPALLRARPYEPALSILPASILGGQGKSL